MMVSLDGFASGHGAIPLIGNGIVDASGHADAAARQLRR